MTSAFLKAFRNSPEESDLFIISMIMGDKIVLQDFTSPVGKGSSAHCLFGEAMHKKLSANRLIMTCHESRPLIG